MNELIVQMFGDKTDVLNVNVSNFRLLLHCINVIVLI